MNKIDEIMAQALVFASAWSLVGGRFDNGNMLTKAEEAKAELRQMIEALAQPAGEAEPVYQVKQSVGASIWADVSKDEFVGAIRHDLKRRILYTTPQQSQPLTDEQKQHIHNQTGSGHALICLVESYIKGVTE